MNQVPPQEAQLGTLREFIHIVNELQYSSQLENESDPDEQWKIIHPLTNKLATIKTMLIPENYRKDFFDALFSYIEIVLRLVSAYKNDSILKQKYYAQLYLVNIISNFFQDRHVANAFAVDVTERVFDAILSGTYSILSKKELLKLFISIIDQTEVSVRKKLAHKLAYYAYSLIDSLSNYGDYFLQAEIMELWFVVFASYILSNDSVAKHLLPGNDELGKCLITDIKENTFDSDLRLWLNKFNATSLFIFSVPCNLVQFGDTVCKYPFELQQHMWVDFNLKDSMIGFYAEVPSSKTLNQILIVAKDVKKVDINRKMALNKNETVLSMQLSKPCLTDISSEQKYWSSLKRQLNIHIDNSQKDIINKLITHVLPQLFGDVFEHSAPRISNILKPVYRPLKISTFKRRSTTSVKSTSTIKSSEVELKYQSSSVTCSRSVSQKSSNDVKLRREKSSGLNLNQNLKHDVSWSVTDYTRSRHSAASGNSCEEVITSLPRVTPNGSLNVVELPDTLEISIVSTSQASEKDIQDNIVTSTLKSDFELGKTASPIISGNLELSALILERSLNLDLQAPQVLTSSPVPKYSQDYLDTRKKFFTVSGKDVLDLNTETSENSGIKCIEISSEEFSEDNFETAKENLDVVESDFYTARISEVLHTQEENNSESKSEDEELKKPETHRYEKKAVYLFNSSSSEQLSQISLAQDEVFNTDESKIVPELASQSSLDSNISRTDQKRSKIVISKFSREIDINQDKSDNEAVSNLKTVSLLDSDETQSNLSALPESQEKVNNSQDTHLISTREVSGRGSSEQYSGGFFSLDSPECPSSSLRIHPGVEENFTQLSLAVQVGLSERPFSEDTQQNLQENGAEIINKNVEHFAHNITPINNSEQKDTPIWNTPELVNILGKNDYIENSEQVTHRNEERSIKLQKVLDVQNENDFDTINSALTEKVTNENQIEAILESHITAQTDVMMKEKLPLKKELIVVLNKEDLEKFVSNKDKAVAVAMEDAENEQVDARLSGNKTVETSFKRPRKTKEKQYKFILSDSSEDTVTFKSLEINKEGKLVSSAQQTSNDLVIGEYTSEKNCTKKTKKKQLNFVISDDSSEDILTYKSPAINNEEKLVSPAQQMSKDLVVEEYSPKKNGTGKTKKKQLNFIISDESSDDIVTYKSPEINNEEKLVSSAQQMPNDLVVDKCSPKKNYTQDNANYSKTEDAVETFITFVPKLDFVQDGNKTVYHKSALKEACLIEIDNRMTKQNKTKGVKRIKKIDTNKNAAGTLTKKSPGSKAGKSKNNVKRKKQDANVSLPLFNEDQPQIEENVNQDMIIPNEPITNVGEVKILNNDPETIVEAKSPAFEYFSNNENKDSPDTKEDNCQKIIVEAEVYQLPRTPEEGIEKVCQPRKLVKKPEIRKRLCEDLDLIEEWDNIAIKKSKIEKVPVKRLDLFDTHFVDHKLPDKVLEVEKLNKKPEIHKRLGEDLDLIEECDIDTKETKIEKVPVKESDPLNTLLVDYKLPDKVPEVEELNKKPVNSRKRRQLYNKENFDLEQMINENGQRSDKFPKRDDIQKHTLEDCELIPKPITEDPFDILLINSKKSTKKANKAEKLNTKSVTPRKPRQRKLYNKENFDFEEEINPNESDTPEFIDLSVLERKRAKQGRKKTRTFLQSSSASRKRKPKSNLDEFSLRSHEIADLEMMFNQSCNRINQNFGYNNSNLNRPFHELSLQGPMDIVVRTEPTEKSSDEWPDLYISPPPKNTNKRDLFNADFDAPEPIEDPMKVPEKKINVLQNIVVVEACHPTQVKPTMDEVEDVQLPSLHQTLELQPIGEEEIVKMFLYILRLVLRKDNPQCVAKFRMFLDLMNKLDHTQY